ncbi:poly-beta-1,6-N-acetyl-D-glucosamine biosynthesis protein PgaD [Crenobacter cavernae]|uniref:Poly-beta-1,6-N-acetyl-D-glucosamine biosynthesis protein PgaD n=1 Tax=Crenobacter cavernae TaxID=2290923 RepID=A0A345Y8E6_9NEIS|nr:poly-beta-1,6-N-acetyl-D-glucosamine biosynthesis protein PgaD [Crenobacter cavernae]AXK40198.1 poly-beta-1,6-N-acetyl-D-glucosamine biosynthesis protein PgaD [Crenobacter cavernae]
MSTQTLIIDARHQLNLPQRMLSSTLTAMLWMLWFYLWLPALSLLAWLSGFRAFYQQMIAQPVWLRGPQTFSMYLLTLFAAACALALWARLSQRQGLGCALQQGRTVPLFDYAQHFGANAGEIETGRDASVVVVHHDAEGRIVQIATQTVRHG